MSNASSFPNTRPTFDLSEPANWVSSKVSLLAQQPWLQRSRVLGIARPFDAVAAITLWTLILLRHDLYWNIVSLCFGVVAIVPAARRNGWFWISLSAVLVAPMLWAWHRYEDHVYFAVYWTTAIGLSRFGLHQRRSLAMSGRWLIGLAMAFAVLWKAVSGQYLSTEMFHHHVLVDSRFCTVIAQPVGGVTDEAIAKLESGMLALQASDAPASFAVASTQTLFWIAAWMTVWTILIEAVLAVCFLWPKDDWIRRLRNPLMIGFMISTYLVVPVVGFALLFSAMGIAQTTRRERPWQAAYALFAFSLVVYALLGYQNLV